MKYAKTITGVVATGLTFLVMLGFDIDQALILEAVNNILQAFSGSEVQ